jgi:hypothetical protein
VDDDARLLRDVADRLEALAAVSTQGDWRTAGLLASRPEVVAYRADGSTEHVAEARAASVRWVTALSPTVAGPLAAVLRDADPGPAVVALARVLDARLPG